MDPATPAVVYVTSPSHDDVVRILEGQWPKQNRIDDAKDRAVGTDAQGKPVAVTGTYIEPDVPWPGNGPRPLLAYATGPYGAGEQCAPSRLFNQGIHFSQGFDLTLNVEEGFIATLLARGYAIVVTDGVDKLTQGTKVLVHLAAANGNAATQPAHGASSRPARPGSTTRPAVAATDSGEAH